MDQSVRPAHPRITLGELFEVKGRQERKKRVRTEKKKKKKRAEKHEEKGKERR
jgi:hypothetical protein